MSVLSLLCHLFSEGVTIGPLAIPPPTNGGYRAANRRLTTKPPHPLAPLSCGSITIIQDKKQKEIYLQ